MSCVYTYNGVNYSYAELAAALHGGLLEKLVTDGDVRVEPDNTTEEVRLKPAEPISQLGTGANVYYETKKYRVNDNTKNGRYLLNVGAADSEVPMANVEFEDVDEAIYVAKKLNENNPDGLVSDYHNIDKIISNLKSEYATKITGAESVDVGEPSRNGEEVGEGNTQKEATEKKEKKPKTETLKRTALAMDAFDAEDFVLQYFVRGGKISTKIFESMYGVKNNPEATKRKVEGERKARISYLSKAVKYEKTDHLAERIYEDIPEYLHDTIELSDVRDALEDVINSYKHPARMAERMISKYANMDAEIEGAYEVDENAITNEEVDALEAQPEIQEAVEMTLENLSDEQLNAFNSVIERFTENGVIDYDGIIDAIDNFDFGADAIFVEDVNRMLDNNLKQLVYEYRQKDTTDAVIEDSGEKGVAERELEAKIAAAKEVLTTARLAYDRKKMQLGRDILEEQPALFEEEKNDVLFDTDANVSQSNIDAILKPYKTDVENAQAKVDELTSAEALNEARASDKLQTQITFTQSLVNDAIGIGDVGKQNSIKLMPISNKAVFDYFKPKRFADEVGRSLTREFTGKDGRRYYILQEREMFSVFDADDFDAQIEKSKSKNDIIIDVDKRLKELRDEVNKGKINRRDAEVEYESLKQKREINRFVLVPTKIGGAIFNNNDANFFTGYKENQSILVDESHRRNGVATAITNFAEEKFGKPYKPTDLLSKEMTGFASNYISVLENKGIIKKECE